MTAPLVRVVDHMPFEAAVTPEQALAYCRRVLVGWEEQNFGASVQFYKGDARLWMPGPDGKDFAYWASAMCLEIVALGFAAKPSEVLRAMAAEVVA